MSFKSLPGKRKTGKTALLKKTSRLTGKKTDDRNVKVDFSRLPGRSGVRHKAVEEHISIVKEPMPACSICGKPVTLISTAIREQNGSFSHFDCVIERLKEEYSVGPHETVSYIGQGNFAVVDRDENGKMFFRERIPYETSETFSEMKKFVEDSKE